MLWQIFLNQLFLHAGMALLFHSAQKDSGALVIHVNHYHVSILMIVQITSMCVMKINVLIQTLLTV